MFHLLGSLFITIVLWVTHYELPHKMREEPYLVKGLCNSHFQNTSTIPGTAIYFTSFSDMYNTTAFQLQNNNTYYVKYWIEVCTPNEKYAYTVINHVIWDFVTIWIFNCVLFCALGYELTRKENSKTYRIFLCVWHTLCAWALMGLILLDVQALKDPVSRHLYVTQPQYSMKGVVTTNTSTYDNYGFDTQFEFYDRVCGMTKFNQETVWAKFEGYQLNTYNPHKQLDLIMLVSMTMSCILVLGGYFVWYCYHDRKESEKIKEEYGEL